MLTVPGFEGVLLITDDAQFAARTSSLFSRHIAQDLPRALWLAQNDAHGDGLRRPYVMIGLPFVSIRPNLINAHAYLRTEYANAIAYWSRRATQGKSEKLRNAAKRFSVFLTADLQSFYKSLGTENKRSRY